MCSIKHILNQHRLSFIAEPRVLGINNSWVIRLIETSNTKICHFACECNLTKMETILSISNSLIDRNVAGQLLNHVMKVLNICHRSRHFMKLLKLQNSIVNRHLSFCNTEGL